MDGVTAVGVAVTGSMVRGHAVVCVGKCELGVCPGGLELGRAQGERAMQCS